MVSQIIQVALDATTDDGKGGFVTASTSHTVMLPPFTETASAQTTLSTVHFYPDGEVQPYISRYRSGYKYTDPGVGSVTVINSIPDCELVEFTLLVTPLGVKGSYVAAASVGTIFIGT